MTSQSDQILLVEPDVIIRMEIARYLRGCGFQVVEGVAAEEAMTILEADIGVSIVFSNANIAGEKTGFELAQEVRAKFPKVDVVLTTSVSNAVEKAEGLCQKGHLTVPYAPQEITQRIHYLRELRRTQK